VGYGTASVVLTGLYPVLPEPWRGIDVLAVSAGAGICVAYGRRSVRPDSRLPWTLLLWALFVIVGANLLLVLPVDGIATAASLVDAAGNLILLAAALALIIRCGARDYGGIVDATVVAFTAGSLLWAFLPHRVGPDQSFAAQVDLFVVVFALTGVAGALLRLLFATRTLGSALWWLLVAIALAIGGNIVLAIGGADPVPFRLGNMLFLLAFTATGLFGLDESGPALVRQRPAALAERLTAARLAFLGVAVAIVPTVVGGRAIIHGNAAGLLLTVQGVFVAALVMVRIGLLSAQRDQAERALEHQATHDPLTGLPNRLELVRRLAGALNQGIGCVLLFCDLDDFKGINDRYGHATGDRLLIEVGQRLRGCVPPPHTISRFGGDEFVVLLVNTPPSEVDAVQDCISATLARSFDQVDGATVGVSIGVAYTDGERDPERLIRLADRAMYRVKASRRDPSPTA